MYFKSETYKYSFQVANVTPYTQKGSSRGRLGSPIVKMERLSKEPLATVTPPSEGEGRGEISRNSHIRANIHRFITRSIST